MKCEEISDALGLLDESMIGHALMVRRKRKKTPSNRNKIWKVKIKKNTHRKHVHKKAQELGGFDCLTL